MPTMLPSRRRAKKKRSLLGAAFSVLFNTAMVVSALILTFIVLVREEQFASGTIYHADPPGAQSTPQNPANTGDAPPAADLPPD